jgi:hypothetical protein
MKKLKSIPISASKLIIIKKVRDKYVFDLTTFLL